MHKSHDVTKAIIHLNDALCTWERTTGLESVLILREQGGFVHRSVSGKPGAPDDVTDQELINIIARGAPMKEIEREEQCMFCDDPDCKDADITLRTYEKVSAYMIKNP